MESTERLKQKVLQEKRVANRLDWAQARLEAAERERIWAIASAHTQGLSIRKIATATTLSSSRVHQLLHTDEADQIPEWLNSLDEVEDPVTDSAAENNSPALGVFKQQLAQEVELMSQCIDWLEQLARGERVVVNLRAESDPERSYVGVDQVWVLRVLKRITADLDKLSGHLSPTEENPEDSSDPITAGVAHRRRLAEPEPTMSSLSQRDQRAILRETINLPLRDKL